MKSQTTTSKTSMTAPLYTIDGVNSGSVDLDSSIFGKEDNKKLIAHYVYIYLQNQRQGTASTLTRSEVNATTKKIYRQKGTGGARHGSLRAPIYVGGGISGGPKPRDYSKSLNKNQKRLSLQIALSNSARKKTISVLEGDHSGMKPKTKVISTFLHTLKLSSTPVLFVLKNVEANGLVLSVRNNPQVKIVSAHTLNAYDVLSYRHIIFVQEALDAISHSLKTRI